MSMWNSERIKNDKKEKYTQVAEWHKHGCSVNAICKIYLIIWCTVSTSMSTNLVSEPKVTSDRKKRMNKTQLYFHQEFWTFN